ncbi:hypothetical protein CO653_06255 [Rhizobium anhuiense]|nr:hypothetical protein CO653_06255 [Rhizobium anhuiense]
MANNLVAGVNACGKQRCGASFEAPAYGLRTLGSRVADPRLERNIQENLILVPGRGLEGRGGRSAQSIIVFVAFENGICPCEFMANRDLRST